jgi:hypothetical protein
MRTPLLILLATAFGVACSDSTSPNDRQCERGTVAHPAAVTGTLSASSCTFTVGATSVAYADYSVTLSQGERYQFTLTADGAWQPALELRQPQRDDSVLVTGLTDAKHSEILLVAPYSGAYTLRVHGAAGAVGAYTLRSSLCGGSSQEIFSTSPVSTTGTIDASTCVVHDRFLTADSTRANLYVLYLGRQETKRITVKATSGTLTPTFILTGPFLDHNSVSSRQLSVAGTDSLSTTVGGGSVAGDYILAVGGAQYGQMGTYTLTVSPAP